ncbi:MAG: amidohydrolase [Hyphomicrobiales bacterium]|nr:amidohydrolase [Hyphomicrobiales bacterium]MBV8824256.1 amidohydrolase [Hyphomicrobiales bacterium]MBV9428588.1 amidohydrolase [Bradyrhizobiaceae bacterium]
MTSVSVDGPEILRQARTILPEVIELRRRLHQRPELGLMLPATRAAVLQALAPLGLELTLSDTISSVVADLRGEGGSGPTVLLRADMDALPIEEKSGEDFASLEAGRMHACGHDAHAAMLVGAANLLSARRGSIAGTVRFVFQPGEENHFGAQLMMRDGVAEGVDCAYALHVTPSLPAGVVGVRNGPIMSAANTFVIIVRGIGGHASLPHVTTDPVPAMCQIVQALQSLVSRELSAFDPAIVGVGQVFAGHAINAIPATAKIAGTFRTTSSKARATIKKAIYRLAEGVAATNECVAEVSIGDGYPATVNASSAYMTVRSAACRILPRASVIDMPHPLLGADDFGFVLREVPGAMSLLGVCPADVATPTVAPPCHADRFRINEPSLAVGIGLHVATALTALSQ